MPNITRQKEAAEAVCSGLYNTQFVPLGDTDEGASTWFTRGEKPKIIRVEVQRSKLADFVLVNTEWANLSLPGHVIRGREVFQIPTDESVSWKSVTEATQAAVVRVLEIFRDVLAGEGVAGSKILETRDFS